ncbi:MAG: Crp/Fnr family transcriptional regulator [Leptolyngbya sp. Prado105]|jgi:CRP-like cAMP-binding protein|nr:Crp/Fnr family transcriptional regulator [Leptolyngbya sp. Prado105]
MCSFAVSGALENRLLATLPSESYQRLSTHLELVTLVPQQILHPIGEAISHIYFPIRSIISLTTLLSNGSILEVGLVGEDGFVGASAILGRRESPQCAIVQIGDRALRLPIEQLFIEFKRGSEFQSLLLGYVQVLLLQVSQTAACHRFHAIRQRLARQLLLIQDTLQVDEFAVTHEGLAQMLGTRRSGISVAAYELSREGVIWYSRGKVRILQRQELEQIACECHAVIRAELEKFHHHFLD